MNLCEQVSRTVEHDVLLLYCCFLGLLETFTLSDPLYKSSLTYSLTVCHPCIDMSVIYINFCLLVISALASVRAILAAATSLLVRASKAESVRSTTFSQCSYCSLFPAPFTSGLTALFFSQAKSKNLL